MIDILKEIISTKKTKEEKYNLLREQLQLMILKILDEKGYFRNIAFLGGTALRILYQLKRFSEDLDFSLINSKNYHFSQMIETIKKELAFYNIEVETKSKDAKIVASSFIKFPTLLHQLNLSQHHDQKLMIKFEVDQNPPSGYQTEFTLLNGNNLINILHFDKPSLFAGKLHALLTRKYAKGRDYYDYIWYCSNKIKPNYLLLNNSLSQTQHRVVTLNSEKLKKQLTELFQETDFKKIKSDVLPFLEEPNEARFFEESIFLNLTKAL